MEINLLSIIEIITPIILCLGWMYKKLSTTNQSAFLEMRNDLNEIRKDIGTLDKKLSRLEDRLEFSGKIVYVQHEDLKEN